LKSIHPPYVAPGEQKRSLRHWANRHRPKRAGTGRFYCERGQAAVPIELGFHLESYASLGSDLGKEFCHQPGVSAEHFDLPAKYQIGNDFRGCGPITSKVWLGNIWARIVFRVQC